MKRSLVNSEDKAHCLIVPILLPITRPTVFLPDLGQVYQRGGRLVNPFALAAGRPILTKAMLMSPFELPQVQAQRYLECRRRRPSAHVGVESSVRIILRFIEPCLCYTSARLGSASRCEKVTNRGISACHDSLLFLLDNFSKPEEGRVATFR